MSVCVCVSARDQRDTKLIRFFCLSPWVISYAMTKSNAEHIVPNLHATQFNRLKDEELLSNGNEKKIHKGNLEN